MAHFHHFPHHGAIHWTTAHVRHHLPFALYTAGTIAAMAYLGTLLLRVA